MDGVDVGDRQKLGVCIFSTMDIGLNCFTLERSSPLRLL